MPLIKVQASVTAPDSAAVQDLLTTLSSKLATHMGKPESYVMTAFEPDVAMTFGGTTDPVCFVEIKNIGTMQPAQTQAMSQDFCETIETALGVPKNRTYIEFADAQRHLWGWDGRTFA